MDLHARVAEIDRGFSGILGVAAHNLTTGQHLAYQANHSFHPASTIKLPILFEVFRGVLEDRWHLDDMHTLTEDDMAAGAGVLRMLTPGLQLSIRDLAVLMITVSDNTATNMLLDLCSVDAVNRSLCELGIQGVHIYRKIGLKLNTPLGQATPAGMARLMELIATHQVLTPALCGEMIDILSQQLYKDFTSRYIPATDSEDGPAPVRIASKSGWIRGVRNDVALIRTPCAAYILSMFSQDCRDRRYYVDNEGATTLARVSQAIYKAWGIHP